MKKIKTKHFERISKTLARKMYNRGNFVYIVPLNLDPENMWQPAAPISAEINGEDFDATVNSYAYYNCVTKEAGRYPAFYKKR